MATPPPVFELFALYAGLTAIPTLIPIPASEQLPQWAANTWQVHSRSNERYTFPLQCEQGELLAFLWARPDAFLTPVHLHHWIVQPHRTHNDRKTSTICLPSTELLIDIPLDWRTHTASSSAALLWTAGPCATLPQIGCIATQTASIYEPANHQPHNSPSALWLP